MLLRMVPESQEPIETAVDASAEQAVVGDMDWFDLYDSLSNIAFRGIMCPAFQGEGRKSDLLGGSFDFVETLLRSSNESVSGAAYLQLVQPLFGSEDNPCSRRFARDVRVTRTGRAPRPDRPALGRRHVRPEAGELHPGQCARHRPFWTFA
ncbi:hypothetical protein ACWFRQ_06545 [Streptomyces niveus]